MITCGNVSSNLERDALNQTRMIELHASSDRNDPGKIVDTP
jgi:hypothetical protein